MFVIWVQIGEMSDLVSYLIRLNSFAPVSIDLCATFKVALLCSSLLHSGGCLHSTNNEVRIATIPAKKLHFKVQFQFLLLHFALCATEGGAVLRAQRPHPPAVQTFCFLEGQPIKGGCLKDGWQKQLVSCRSWASLGLVSDKYALF